MNQIILCLQSCNLETRSMVSKALKPSL